jgi:hypothetical protein
VGLLKSSLYGAVFIRALKNLDFSLMELISSDLHFIKSSLAMVSEVRWKE